MIKLVEKIIVFFDGVEKEKFDDMLSALSYINENGIGKKVKMQTSKEYVSC